MRKPRVSCVDAGSVRVTRLRLHATGEAWGRGRWTPRPPAGRFPLTVVMVEAAADDRLARVVPPQAAGCGVRYAELR